MQYILIQEEYDKLIDNKKTIQLENTKKLQELCTKIANEMPIKVSWRPKDNPVPWGCIITFDAEYCDECPVREICPNQFKEWSQ